jgi:hypothetical protein
VTIQGIERGSVSSIRSVLDGAASEKGGPVLLDADGDKLRGEMLDLQHTVVFPSQLKQNHTAAVLTQTEDATELCRNLLKHPLQQVRRGALNQSSESRTIASDPIA